MSEQDRIAFEKFISELDFQDIVHDAESIRNLYCREWQAATEEANKRIEVLEGEVAELKQDRNDLNYLCMERLHKIESIEAHINTLREALSGILPYMFDVCDKGPDGEGWKSSKLMSEIDAAEEALSATPAESLAKHDDELIEKCARVCDEDAKQSREFAEPFAARCAELLAEAIRALKGK